MATESAMVRVRAGIDATVVAALLERRTDTATARAGATDLTITIGAAIAASVFRLACAGLAAAAAACLPARAAMVRVVRQLDAGAVALRQTRGAALGDA
jgi:hypothetical protein